MKDSIKDYKQQKDALIKRFQAEKTGEQTYTSEQAKLFNPLLQSQKQIQDKLTEGTSNVLVPFIQELQRRNAIVEDSQNLPFHKGIESVPQLSPISRVQKIDLDSGLNETDKENLMDLSLELSSEIYLKGEAIGEISDKIDF